MSLVVKTTVWIPLDVLDKLFAEAEAWAPAETGGILVGYWADSSVAVITDGVDAGPAAVREPTRFSPDAAYQRDRLAEIYLASGRHHVYLGDWHSHPAGGGTLSRRDRRTMRTIARSRRARCPRPLMLVLAHDQQWVPIPWVAVGGRYRVTGRPAAMSLYNR